MFGWVITRVHLDRGFGSRANSWIVNLKGGGWYNNIRTCVYRKTTRRGSSNYFKRQIPFTGVLSNKASENPDFYNWNRVKICYCDGASFAGDSENKGCAINFVKCDDIKILRDIEQYYSAQIREMPMNIDDIHKHGRNRVAFVFDIKILRDIEQYYSAQIREMPMNIDDIHKHGRNRVAFVFG